MEEIIKIVFAVVLVYYIYGTYVSARALFMPKMKKSLRIACLLRVVSALFVLTGLVMYFVIHLNDEVRTYTYVKGVINEQSSYGQYESMFFTIFITAAVLVLASAPFDCYGALKASSRVRNVVVSLIMSAAVMISGLILIISNYSGNLYDNDPKYYRYDSPDKSRSIVICERSNFSDGYGDIYQVQGEKAEKIGSFSTKDGLRNNGKYRLEWSPTQVKVSYRYSEDVYRSAVGKYVELGEKNE